MDREGRLLDDVYAYGLSRALMKVAPPSTVGLFSQCPGRTETLLHRIKVYMNREAEWRAQKHKMAAPRTPCLNFLSLLLCILFLQPVWTEEEERRRKRVRWIFVRFNAWHFAGSDKLWAGLMVRLFKAMQNDFGSLPLGLYRATQAPYPKRVQSEGSGGSWKARRLLCMPLWLAVLLAAFLCLGACLFLFMSGLQIQSQDWTKFSLSAVAVLESLALATLGPPALLGLRFLLKTTRSLLHSQGNSILHLLNRSSVKDQLGFMDKVRKEVGVLVDFLHFMEVFENRRIRVVLEVTHLDRCPPARVVSTLQAMNVLLSGENIPFVSILAADPRILINCLEASAWLTPHTVSGYNFLNRMVTLPFSIPDMSPGAKRQVFKTLVGCHLEIWLADEGGMRSDGGRREKGKAGGGKKKKANLSALEKGLLDETVVPFIGEARSGSEVFEDGLRWEVWARKVKAQTDQALQVVCSKENPLHLYLTGDHIHMRRVINSVRVMVVVVEAVVPGGECPVCELAAWVVLASLWPARLSWLLLCLEDNQQGADLTGPGRDSYRSRTLWEEYSRTSSKLHMLRGRLEKVLEQDGDPEILERFLKVDFRLTVEDAERFRPCTVNLDPSIKQELARARREGSDLRVTDTTDLRYLAMKTAANMSTEEGMLRDSGGW